MKNALFRTLEITILSALGLFRFSAEADTFGIGANGFSIDFVNIGNPGNGNDNEPSGAFGGVSYLYRMGTYEIPASAIIKATANGLTGVVASPWGGDRPAGHMSWYQAAAFVNWLNTSTGHHAAYQINAGLTALTLWPSSEAWQADGLNLFRHKDAYYFLPSEDEWYKAAFHKNDGVTANYWNYATGSDMTPTIVVSGTNPGTIVAEGVHTNHGPADVNMAGGLSPYGTMGQSGNLIEVLESAYDGLNDVPSEPRVTRGGGLIPPWNSTPRATFPFPIAGFGYRVASAEVGTGIGSGGNLPEPSTALLLLGTGWIWLLRRGPRSSR